MKRKYFLIILFLILAIFLTGCDILTPDVDKIEIKGVIQNYASAMNNQDWDKAKSYCVYQSWAYLYIEGYEWAIDYYGIEIFAFKIDNIRDIEVEGNYGQANIHIRDTFLVRWELAYLQKINGIWKIYEFYAQYWI